MLKRLTRNDNICPISRQLSPIVRIPDNNIDIVAIAGVNSDIRPGTSIKKRAIRRPHALYGSHTFGLGALRQRRSFPRSKWLFGAVSRGESYSGKTPFQRSKAYQELWGQTMKLIRKIRAAHSAAPWTISVFVFDLSTIRCCRAVITT